MKTVLVTGVAGFIGSHVAEALLARGDRVVGLDNFSDYYSPNRKRENLSAVQSGPNHSQDFHFVEGDIQNRTLLAWVCQQYRPQVIVHLAAMAGVRASVQNPELYYDVNVTGSLNLLEVAVKYQVGNFVFASSSSVYGQTERIPFSEKNPCDRPLSPYASSKRAGELLGHTYYHLHGLNFIALRFFTVYGPRNRPDMMAYKVLESICTGKEVPLYNNGQMYRDWTYVGDIVKGILSAVDRPLGYEIINLGRGKPVLLTDFIQALEIIIGSPCNVHSMPMPLADVEQTYADITLAEKLLNYKPAMSVSDGVFQLWQWYQHQHTMFMAGAK